jgi:hypothetical protein
MFDSASNYDYQEYFLGSKGGRYVGLISSRSCDTCLEFCGGGVNLLETSGTVQARTGIVVPSYDKVKVYLVQEQIANHQRTLFILEKKKSSIAGNFRTLRLCQESLLPVLLITHIHGKVSFGGDIVRLLQ